MRHVYLLNLFLVLFSLDMARCQTKEYKEKLESLYSHSVPVISCSDFANEIESGKPVVILDTRSEKEYEVSHVISAKLIDYDHFKDKDVQSIPKDANIVVYCSVGYRSEKIGERLLDLGFKNVMNLYGGIFQWKNEGYKVVNRKLQITDSVHTYNRKWSKWLVNGTRVY